MVLLIDTHAPAHDCAVVGVVTHVPSAGARRLVNYAAQVQVFRPTDLRPQGEEVYVGDRTRHQFYTGPRVKRLAEAQASASDDTSTAPLGAAA